MTRPTCAQRRQPSNSDATYNGLGVRFGPKPIPVLGEPISPEGVQSGHPVGTENGYATPTMVQDSCPAIIRPDQPRPCPQLLRSQSGLVAVAREHTFDTTTLGQRRAAIDRRPVGLRRRYIHPGRSDQPCSNPPSPPSRKRARPNAASSVGRRVDPSPVHRSRRGGFCAAGGC